MPWMKVKDGDKTKVFKKGEDGEPTGSALGTYDSDADADKQIAALNANEGGSKQSGKKDWDDIGGLPESMGKLPQSDPRVQYDPAGGLGGGGKACANCQWFIPAYASGGGDRCQVVSGPIFPTGLSKLWFPKGMEQPVQEPMPVIIVDQAEKAIPVLSADEKKELKKLSSPGLVAHLKALLGIKSDSPVLKALDIGTETGFKALDGNRWIAWWTNNFQDNHKEVFPAAAIDRYIERCDKEEMPYPELWYWHTFVPHGKADWLGRIDHLSLATGTFYETEAAELMKKEYAKSDHAVSHGFFFLKSQKESDGSYQDFYTYEISPLPIGKEANPITWFGVKEMNTLTAEKKAKLDSILGPELAAKLIQAGEQKSKEIEALGVKFKELNTEPTPTFETPAQSAKEDSEIAIAFKEITDLIVQQGQAIKQLMEQNKAREQRIDSLEGFVKEQFALQPRATRSPSTVLTENNPYLAYLGKKQLEQEAGKKSAAGQVGGVLGKIMEMAAESSGN